MLIATESLTRRDDPRGVIRGKPEKPVDRKAEVQSGGTGGGGEADQQHRGLPNCALGKARS